MDKSDLKVRCPSCGRTFSNVKPEYIGKDAQCMQCGNIFTIELPITRATTEPVQPVSAAPPAPPAPPAPEPAPEPEEVIAEVEPEPEEVIAEVEPEPVEVIAEVEPEPVEVIAEVEPEPVEVIAEVEPEPEEVIAEVEPEPEEVIGEVEPEVIETVEVEVESVDPYERTELYAEPEPLEPAPEVEAVEIEAVDPYDQTELYGEAEVAEAEPIEVEAEQMAVVEAEDEENEEDVFLDAVAAVQKVETPPETPQDKGWALEELIETIDEEVTDAFGDDMAIGEAVAEEKVDTKQDLFVLFSMNESDYAVPVANVTEISLPLDVAVLPNVPDWVNGVTNLRGEIVSVIDLPLYLGMGEARRDKQTRMLVSRSVRDEDFVTCLLVDSVIGIVSLTLDKIGAATAPIDDQVTRYLRGVYEHEDRLVVVLNIEILLLSDDMRQFEMDLA